MEAGLPTALALVLVTEEHKRNLVLARAPTRDLPMEEDSVQGQMFKNTPSPATLTAVQARNNIGSFPFFL